MNPRNPRLSRGFAQRDPHVIGEIATCLAENRGNIHAAARGLSLAVNTLRHYIHQEPALATALLNARAKALADSPLLPSTKTDDEPARF